MTATEQIPTPEVTVGRPRTGIVVVTIANERRGNALTPEMTSALMRTWTDIETDPEARVAVVTAAGGRAFSAGNDLTGTPPEPDEDPAWNFAGLNELAAMTKPVIAAINGYAVGGGAEIALACDLRIAATTASFAFPEPRVGVIASVGGTQRLPRMIGQSRAMHMLLSTEPVDAPTALQWGLVTALHEPEVLLTAALDMAEGIAGLGPRAVRATKACVNRAFDLPLPEGRKLERSVSAVLRYSDERAEGGAAFRDKRRPVFPPATPEDPEMTVLP